MSIALYRKYRSQDFDEIVGQDHITNLLKSTIKKQAISHAYLFVGSRGTGKTSTARIFSKAVNCLQPTEQGNPCNECKVCKSINSGKFLDLVEIDAASNRGIDKIRELKEKLEFSPVEGKYKVYIVDEVHMLTKEAFNALLKTLEEPPKHVIFILATTEVHKLPSTILSRCQRYDFKLGTDKQIEQVLLNVAKGEDIELADEALDLLVKSAQGSYRDGLSFLDIVVSGQMIDKSSDKDAKLISEEEVRKILGLPEKLAVEEFINHIVEGKDKRAVILLRDLESRGINFQQFVKEILEVLRKELVNSITEKDIKFHMNKKQILQLIKLFIEVDRDLYYSSVQGLPLEMAVVQSEKIFPEEDIKEEQESTEEEDGGEDIEEEDEIETDSEDSLLDDGVEDSEETKVELKVESKTSEPDEVEVKLKKKISEVKKENSNSTGDIKSMKDIKSKWKEIRTFVKKENKHLYAILQGAKLKEFTHGVLKMSVSYKYHKETLESVKSRTMLHAACNSIYGCSINYECIIEKRKINKAKKNSPLDLGIVQQVKQTVQKKVKNKKNQNDGVSKSQVEEIFADL